jgi:hypothetical protein
MPLGTAQGETNIVMTNAADTVFLCFNIFDLSSQVSGFINRGIGIVSARETTPTIPRSDSEFKT